MLDDFNNKLAEKLSNSLSTMAMFYGICFLVVSILFFQMPKTSLEWVQYIVQTFFQGVALPVLGFVSKTEGNRTNKIIQEIHDTTMAEIQDLKDMHVDIHNLIKDKLGHDI